MKKLVVRSDSLHTAPDLDGQQTGQTLRQQPLMREDFIVMGTHYKPLPLGSPITWYVI